MDDTALVRTRRLADLLRQRNELVAKLNDIKEEIEEHTAWLNKYVNTEEKT